MSQEKFTNNDEQNKSGEGVPFDPNNSERIQMLNDKFEPNPKGILGKFKDWNEKRKDERKLRKIEKDNKRALRFNCRICNQVEASGVNLGVPHDCKDHQMK